jgi:3-deoxy-D-manno-octulosonate 8-phosphate phosphatase (KDO 8-P phosphatase)
MNLERITLIILDVDGTMTDGGVYIDSNLVETKKFNIKDGSGIGLAQSAGIEFMLLTGRSSACVEQRAKELRIKYVAQGIQDKAAYLKQFMAERGFSSEHIAYIGDDLNDLPAMRYAGVSACPADAADEVKAYCDFVLSCKGGEGAVREFIELVLEKKNLWEKIIN